jgi:glucokinase
MSGPERLVLGVDVGGTKLAAGVVSESGRVLDWRSIPARVGDGPDVMIERHIELCRESLAASGLAEGDVLGIGIGCGGPLDPIAGIIQEPPNLPGWVDVPIVARFEAAFAHRAVVENDASAAALGEATFGAGRGRAIVIYLTVSTGIGGGIVIDGRLFRGAGGNAGEVGHQSLRYDPDGWPCICGRRGCLEAFASGTNIARRAREAVGAGESSLLVELAGGRVEAVTAETVVAGVRAGDSTAVRVWEETLDVLTAGVANLLNIFNPDIVILGGGVTNAGDLLFEPLRTRAIRAALPPARVGVEIVPAALGRELGVVGAAAIGFERLGG